MSQHPVTMWQLPRLLLDLAPEAAHMGRVLPLAGPALRPALRVSGWID